MTRADALAAVQAAVDRDVAALKAMVQMSVDEATSEQSKPENKYDTRALEASYLAAGQGRRLMEIKRLQSWLANVEGASEMVGAGSLVHLESDAGSRWVLVAPIVGPTVAVGEHELTVISTASPLGSALLGLEEGDGVELRRAKFDIEAVL